MAARKKAAGASPYATGGGGVTFEQLYGASLLSALLLGDPVPGLGDEMTVVRVQFQAGPTSPVDDYVVYGEAPSGSRRLSVGVRHAPTIASSDTKFVHLLGDYLRIVIENSGDVDADRWRLGLVVADPNTGATDTALLADFARAHAAATSFRETIARDGATTARVRERLRLLDEAVSAAVADAKLTAQAGDLGVLTWRLLRSLRPIQIRVEGGDAPDRTHVISRLRSIANDASDAEDLFRVLCELAGTLATKGGIADEAMLRRELVGVNALARSSAHRAAWSLLGTCEDQLRERTRNNLLSKSTVGTPVTLSLVRGEQLHQLSTLMRDAGKGAAQIIVSGEPDVGKSALALAAADLLRNEGGVVIALSLRDLPRTPVEVDHLLGAPLGTVLGGAAVAASRLVLLDGAEAALEGKADTLAHLARAAARAGLAVVAVTRDDALATVQETLNGAAGRAPVEFDIAPLTDAEIAEIVHTFPMLSRVADEPRSRWLLGRLGLVEVLLRSGAYAALPDGALSEADVFAAVWRCVVRQGEMHTPGEATPDGREAALVGLARKQLDPYAPASAAVDPLALASLRSDLLLLPLGPTAAWNAGDDFANDLIRDFATARLLLTSGGEAVLANAGGPRSAIRAARLACQASLLHAGASAEKRRTAAQASFDVLARDHGERWSDLVWEAVLTLGSASTALKHAAPAILQDRGAPLAHLLRVARQRFCRRGLPDLVLVAPIVEFLCDQKEAVRTLPTEVREQADEIVSLWLAGLAVRGKDDTSNALRRRARDELLTASPRRGDHHLVDCFGLLGPDLDARVESALRELAERDPYELHSCLESSFAPISLAVHHPDLLIALADAYYIERPDPEELPWRRHRPLDEGIRRHHGPDGIRSRFAAWHYGPFWHLLRARPREAIALINRMLNHAARYRVAREDPDPSQIALEQLQGIEVNLPELGERRFIGDDHVWRWYRGSGVGPYPCISALLAVERLVDQLVALDVPLKKLVPMLLSGCENLAMPGLLFGTLTRYADRLSDELDPWLVEPPVWELEFVRTTSDMLDRFHVQGPDPDDLPGRERRKWSPREVGACLVVCAIQRKDNATLARLTALGDTLIARAAAMLQPDAQQEESEQGAAEDASAADRAAGVQKKMFVVRGWASVLQYANYRVELTEDGRLAVEYVPPDAVLDGLAADRRDQERGQTAWRLINMYSMGDPATWSHSVIADLALARELEGDPPKSGPPERPRVSAAVAAAALQCHSRGSITLSPAELKWTIDTLVSAAASETEDGYASYHAVFPMGTDRSAARALPHVLMSTDKCIAPARSPRQPLWVRILRWVLGMFPAKATARLPRRCAPLASSTPTDKSTFREQRRAVLQAVCMLAKSSSDEVRRILALELSPLWALPCVRIGSECVHQAVFEAFREAARLSRMGPVDVTTGKRPLVLLDSDVEHGLGALPTEDILLSYLVAPIVVATMCAKSSCCVAERARSLRDALLAAHRRGSVYYAQKNYHAPDDDDRAVAAALLGAGTSEPLLAHVEALTHQASALDGLLDNLAAVATADPVLRRTFRSVWPTVMNAVLSASGEGRDLRDERYGGARALAAVVPQPMPMGAEMHLDAVLRAAADGWPTPTELEGRIERWLPLAAGSPECVDSLVGFLRTAPLQDQADRGLRWVATLVVSRFEGVAKHSFTLPGWLEELRVSGLLNAETMPLYQRLVDGLVAAGDSRALRLQMSIEQ